MPTDEPTKGAIEAAAQWFQPREGDSIGDAVTRDMHRQLAEDIDRLAVAPAVAERDREWVRAMGYEPSGDPGNTPTFVRREMESHRPDYLRENEELLAKLAELRSRLAEVEAERDAALADAARLRTERDNAINEVKRVWTELDKLVHRCDTEEGVRADGSNIDTCAAHAALAASEGGGE